MTLHAGRSYRIVRCRGERIRMQKIDGACKNRSYEDHQKSLGYPHKVHATSF